MKNLLNQYLIIILSLLAFACGEETKESLDFSGDVDIHSFTVNGVAGSINTENSTISVILPSGSSLQGLQPQIEIGADATVSPESNEAIDFINNDGVILEQEYIVKAKDLYQKYTVTVDVARAKITSFKIGSVEGQIIESSKKIVMYLPEGTDVTALVPTVEYTDGATLSPSQGTEIDFTNPVNFSLEYLGSTFIYEVTVKLGQPILTIYNGEDINPIWASIASTINNSYSNPKTDGINSSSTCVAIMRNKTASDDGGRAWSGGALWTNNKVNIDPTVYGQLKLMVLKEIAGDVQVEIQSDGETEKGWLRAEYSGDALGEWQELTFNIPDDRTAIINNILVAPHVIDVADDPNFSSHMMYWDDLRAIPKE